MSIDIMASMEQDERAMERVATALESIADSLAQWCKIQENRFDKDYPVRPEPKDATITRIPTADDDLRIDQGASEEGIEEWGTLGPREAKILSRQAASERAKAQKSAARQQSKR